MDPNIQRFVLFLFLFFPLLSYGQDHEPKHDSIMQLIEDAQNDSVKATHYLSLGNLYAYSHQDSAISYYQQAFNLCREGGFTRLAGKCLNYIAVIYIYRSEYDKTIDYLNRSIALKKQAGDTGGMANGYNNLGVIHKNQGNFGKAMEYLQKATRLRHALAPRLTDSSRIINNTEKLGQACNNQGNIHYQFGDYSRAVGFYKRALEHFEKIDNSKGISSCYNNIGNVFEEQQNYDKAKDYYTRALDLNRELNEIRNIGTCLNNLGEIHLKQSQIRQARTHFQKSLKYREKANDKRGISAVYSNLAMVNLKNRNYSKSLDQLHKALKLDNEIGDKKGMAEDMITLARVYLKQDRLNQATDFALQGKRISDTIQAPLQEKSALQILAQIYEKRGDYRRALQYTRDFEEIEDRLFNKEKNQQIEELETKYQLEKKQEEIHRQEELLDRKENLIRKQQVQKYAYIGGIVFVLAISVLIYVNYRQKRNINKLLMEQNEEIESQNEELIQQNEEIRNQRDELERQRNLAHEQRSEIAVKNDEIASSIQYAKTIQSGLLMSERAIRQMLPDHFMLFKPRDIVSGDFYWLHQKNGQVMFAVVDCTGHGVPGAFMSLLGMSFLNDVVQERNQPQAGDVLNRLRTKVIHALRQNVPDTDNRNNIDIALCIWDKENRQLQYAGAYNPLYLVRNGELEEYKANRTTIGIESKLEESFTTQHIQLQQGDTIYLFTDGYPDQLDEKQHEKMNISRFKSLIKDLAPLELQCQKIRLDDHFENWKGQYEQVDDVLVMGVRF
ncbi:MAG: tetratricopeptide repeat protein [Bacteroidales bacterium]|nr:tetratricopeptide repeat protein [Bacteroidales bacterium]